MRAGRNAPCPCGSGAKFKHCCGRAVANEPAAAPPDPRQIADLVAAVHQGRLEEAVQQGQTLLRAHPRAGILWKILGVALMRQGKDALPALRQAAQLLPQDAEAHANLGAELRARGEREAALESLRRSLTLEPRNPDSLIEAADLQRELGRPREALTLYQWALECDPGRVEAHNNMGNALLELAQPAEAVRCYRRALEAGADEAQVLGNLGNALRELGELEEALVCTRRAIELAPELSMAHNNLGLLLAARGQRAEAVASYREALRLRPDYPQALNNLGNVMRELGKRREALAAYRQAVELDSSRADGHCNLGYALLESRRAEHAVASFRTALSLDPKHLSAHLGLATALRVQGLHDDAEAVCRAARALAPESPGVLTLIGELRADRGRFAEAQESFQRALTLNPNFAAAYGSIASHRRMTAEDGAWLRGVEGLLARPLPLGEEIHLRYALGKYFDDMGEYDRAFDSYRQANELSKRAGGGYDRGRLTELIERVTSVCDAEFVRADRPEPSDSERPVFIIGMPRSGTSLTEQIVASHPAVFGAGEVRFWDRAFTELLQRDALERGVALAGLARDYLIKVSARAGASARITDKMPANFLYAGLIHAALPRAKIIHVRRHPLDTCLSAYFQNFFNVSPYANDLEDLAHYYGEYLRIMAHWRAVLPAEMLLEVPYEGLVADAEGWTRRILEFLGLPWDTRCLEFHRTDRVVITASRWQVRQIIHASSVGRWRNYENYIGPLRHLPELVDREVHGHGRADSGAVRDSR
jgi:tetratricopeptide (TPR) repeat protein